jgi:hypothetical protein
MTIWTQNHHLKFVYLVSPGHVSTANLIRLLKETIASLEDHDAEPDIYAIETYIPGFPLVLEKNADGSAAGTITGGAYYLLKHRDGDPNTLHLDAINDSGRPLGKIVKISEAERGGAGGHHFHYRLCIKNTSGWLDYAAVLQARWEGGDDWSLTAKLGDDDISSEVLGGGYLFYRKERLNPGTKQYVDILVNPKHDMEHLPSFHLTFNLLPHAGAHAMNSLQFLDERSIEHRDDTHDRIALPHWYNAALH